METEISERKARREAAERRVSKSMNGVWWTMVLCYGIFTGVISNSVENLMPKSHWYGMLIAGFIILSIGLWIIKKIWLSLLPK